MLRLLNALLCLVLFTQACGADDKSVVAVVVRQPYTNSDGKVEMRSIGMGSGVVVESGNRSTGELGYLAITAAHVVCKEITDRQGAYYPVNYPLGTVFEVCVEKEWYPARLKGVSKMGDVACLSFLCNKHIPLTCLAERRATKREVLSANGFTNGLDQHRIAGKCRGPAEYPFETVAPSGDWFYGTSESFAPGFSGGAVFDKNENLAGIISTCSTLKPGYGAYTHVGDIRRLLKISWDGKFEDCPVVERIPMPDRAVPRSIGDEPEPEPTLAE